MKKLIAAALCFTAIGAQAFEIKGMKIGDKFNCRYSLACGFSEVVKTTFLGQPTNIILVLDYDDRIFAIQIYLDELKMHDAAIAAFSEKYGKPVVGSKRNNFFFEASGFCKVHQWQRDGEELQVSACNNNKDKSVTYDVQLNKLRLPPPPKPPTTYKKSDI